MACVKPGPIAWLDWGHLTRLMANLAATFHWGFGDMIDMDIDDIVTFHREAARRLPARDEAGTGD